jgi:uncharacterized membrane protein
MPPDVTTADWVALGLFLLAWLGYRPMLHLLARGRTINELMVTLRRAWMGAMLGRENRITDAALIGHIMHSATFFASTAILVTAGILGVLGSIDGVHAVIAELAFTQATSRRLFEAKVFLLLVLFVYGFFQFTWALRQLNYTVALVGSAPPAGAVGQDGPAIASNIAAVLDMAVARFNAGLRAYYFALAAVGWFIHPWALIAAAAGVVAILVRRQLLSPARRAIADQTRLLERR